MSATTAQSTDSLASPLSSQDCRSRLLSAVWPLPSPPRTPARSAVEPPPPPPSTCTRTTTAKPTRPRPPPPTASPRPPPRPPPPPRRSCTADVSRLPPSRYLIAARPPPGVRTPGGAPPSGQVQAGRSRCRPATLPPPLLRRIRTAGRVTGGSA